MLYGITQCYLPPDRGGILAFTPAEAGGMQDWVNLGTAVKVRSPCPRLRITVTLAINTTVRGEIRTLVLTHFSRARSPLGHCDKFSLISLVNKQF